LTSAYTAALRAMTSS